MTLIKTTDPIYFDSKNIVSLVPGWITTGTDPNRYPTRDVTKFHIAYTNRSKLTSAFFTDKAINISGIITRSGREELDQSISQLRKLLRPINKTLQLPVSGEQRQFYEATVKNIIVSGVKGGYASISIEFTAADPFNYALTSTELLNVVNLTSGDKSYPVTLDGTAVQMPTITITLDSITTIGSNTVTITDPISGKYVSIQRAWTATEVIVINCREKTVTINGVVTEYEGRIPEWETGAGFINYTDNFTARQVDINVTYYKRYE